MSYAETIPNWLMKRTHLTPNRIAVYFQNEELSFKELYDLSVQYAGKLVTQGVKKGERLAVLLNNHLDTVILLHALQLLGCQTVMLNFRLHEHELIYQINDSEAEHLISEASFSDVANNISKSTKITPIFKEALRNVTESKFAPVKEFRMDDICTIMYTSGTTGFPKGVLQTYGNHWWSSIGSVLNLGSHENDAWLAAVPLFHISGFSILVRNVVYGMPIVLFEKFDPLAINRVLKEGKATIMSVVTSMLQRLVEDLEDDCYHSSFRCMLLGGGPVPTSLLEKCKAKNIPVFQSYGMTETSSQIVTLSPEDSLIKLGSAGKALFPSQIKILKDEKEAEPNEIGEIAVKGPNVTSGYFKRDDANEKSFTSDGWFLTGDVGYVDEEGFLYVIDRRSDLIISGGENIYPAEIENVIQSHPAILEAAVVGVHDEKWGQVPFGFYVIRKGHSVTDQQLYEFCLTQLAKFKVPKKWMQIDEIPKNASNKTLRRNLRLLVE